VVLYGRDADADRAFFRDVLDYPFVDAGHNWLIFTLPPAELAIHPGEATTCTSCL
jgi:catechol 2,3-dioxygenase-like lactoylglutathione lyase family enzyme